jgi:enterochelin esterase-like enzyme
MNEPRLLFSGKGDGAEEVAPLKTHSPPLLALRVGFEAPPPAPPPCAILPAPLPRALILAGLSALFAACSGSPAQSPPADPEPPGPGSSGPEPEWVTAAVNAVNVQRILFHSEAIGREVSAHVYLPDAYATDPSRRFPVLYWLHGGGGSVTQGIPFLADFFHQGMARGDMESTIVVFPNGLPMGMWVDSKDFRQPMETILMKELVPHVDQRFRTVGAREGRVIEGFSMGGYGAARLGFKYPETFGGISILGAGPLQLDFLGEGPRSSLARRQELLEVVYGGSLEYFQAQSPWRLAEALAENDPPGPGVPVRLVVGEQDELLEINRRFHQHLRTLGIPHDYRELPGVGHSPPATFQAMGPDHWAFYRQVFGP